MQGLILIWFTSTTRDWAAGPQASLWLWACCFIEEAELLTQSPILHDCQEASRSCGWGGHPAGCLAQTQGVPGKWGLLMKLSCLRQNQKLVQHKGQGLKARELGNGRVNDLWSRGASRYLLGDPRNGSHTTRTAALQTIDQAALPNIGKAYKGAADSSWQEGSSELFGTACVWEAQAGAVWPGHWKPKTEPGLLPSCPKALTKPLHGLSIPFLYMWAPWLDVFLSLDVTLTSHLQPAWERCWMQGLCDTIQWMVGTGKCHKTEPSILVYNSPGRG